MVLYLKENLEKQGLKQSKIDPCLFYGDGMCVLCYVDDCLFFAKDIGRIDEFIGKLRDNGFSLTVENNIYAFWVWKLTKETRKVWLC